MNIYDIINRARSLREEYRLDSVTPERLGALHEDTLTYINQYQLLASSPAIHKTFVSVSAMQGSASPTSDLTGRPLKAGQLVVIVPSDQTDSTAGDVYRYDGPSGSTSKWTFVAKLGAVPADSELSATSTNPPQNRAVTEKLTELESKSRLFTKKNYFYSAIDGSENYATNILSTPKLPVNGAIRAKCYLGGTSYPNYGIVFFGADKNYISAYTGNAYGFQEVELLETGIPSDARYFSCCHFAQHENAYVLCGIEGSLVNDIEEIETRLADSEKTIENANKELVALKENVQIHESNSDIIHSLISYEFSVKNPRYSAVNGEQIAQGATPVASTPLIPIVGKEIFAYCYFGATFLPDYGIVFFDENRNFIGGYSGEVRGYKKVHLTDDVPTNAAYFVCSQIVNDNTPQCYAFGGNALPIYDEVKELSSVELMMTNGLITDDGVITVSDISQYSNKIYVRPNGLLYYSGGIGSVYGILCYDAEDKVIAGFLKNGTFRNEKVVIPNDTIYVRIQGRTPLHSGFILPVEVLYIESISQIYRNLNQSHKIVVRKISSTSFNLTIPQGIGKMPLVHTFERQRYEANLKYGNGNSKTILCTDIWYPSTIAYNGNNIMQGNLNFIYLVDHTVEGYENEDSHIGAGHGCEIAKYQKFLADGHEVDIDKLTEIECDEFKIICVADNYACDTTQSGFSSSRALLKLDAEGNPILTAVHCYNATFKSGNVITWDNQLLIKRNNIRFAQCHGAMLQGNVSPFDKIVLCSKNYDINTISYNGDWSYNVINGEQILPYGLHDADTIILQGDDAIVEQTMTRDNGEINHIYSVNYSTGDVRTKHYQMPVKTTLQYGSKADVFNNGDLIKVHCERRISVA